MNKKTLITTVASIATISIVSGTVALTSSPQPAGADDTPILQTLSNHEARIKKTENNVKDLQAATGTPESSDNSSIATPEVAQPVDNVTATTTPTAQPTDSVNTSTVSEPFILTSGGEVLGN